MEQREVGMHQQSGPDASTNYANGVLEPRGLEALPSSIASEAVIATAPLTRATTLTAINPSNISSSVRFVRVGVAIMIVFETFYLLADRGALAGFRTDILPLHLFLILSLAVPWLAAASYRGAS